MPEAGEQQGSRGRPGTETKNEQGQSKTTDTPTAEICPQPIARSETLRPPPCPSGASNCMLIDNRHAQLGTCKGCKDRRGLPAVGGLTAEEPDHDGLWLYLRSTSCFQIWRPGCSPGLQQTDDAHRLALWTAGGLRPPYTCQISFTAALINRRAYCCLRALLLPSNCNGTRRGEAASRRVSATSQRTLSLPASGQLLVNSDISCAPPGVAGVFVARTKLSLLASTKKQPRISLAVVVVKPRTHKRR